VKTSFPKALLWLAAPPFYATCRRMSVSISQTSVSVGFLRLGIAIARFPGEFPKNQLIGQKLWLVPAPTCR